MVQNGTVVLNARIYFYHSLGALEFQLGALEFLLHALEFLFLAHVVKFLKSKQTLRFRDNRKS